MILFFCSFLKGREAAEGDPDKRQLMDDLKVEYLQKHRSRILNAICLQTEHNGEYFDGDSDQDEEGAEEPGGS